MTQQRQWACADPGWTSIASVPRSFVTPAWCPGWLIVSLVMLIFDDYCDDDHDHDSILSLTRICRVFLCPYNLARAAWPLVLPTS